MEGDWRDNNELPLILDEHEDGLKKTRSRSETRNKQIGCNVRFRKMRSDQTKCHMRKRRDLYSLDEKYTREQIKQRKRQYENRDERKRLLREIAHQGNAPL